MQEDVLIFSIAVNGGRSIRAAGDYGIVTVMKLGVPAVSIAEISVEYVPLIVLSVD
jgi:hypothetical protein